MCDKIVELVREHESEGITKNQVIKILRVKIGGSRSTFGKCFDELEGKKKGSKKFIELRKEKNYIGNGRLFPTAAASKLAVFKRKIECAERLLGLLEKYPHVGNYYHELPTIESNRIQRFATPVERETRLPRMLGMPEIQEEAFSGRIYRLNASQDLLEKLPFFLISYIRDEDNGLASVESECIEMCNDIIYGCALTKFYEPDASLDAYLTHHKFHADTCYDAKGVDIGEPQDVFLRVLGRYYFLVSMEFSKDWGIDSCKEQRTVTAFLKAFFPEISRAEDGAYQHGNVAPADLSIHVRNEIVDRLPPEDSADTATIAELLDRLYHKRSADWGVPQEMRSLVPLCDNIAYVARIQPLFLQGEGERDPPGISEYYLRWMFSAKVFYFDEMVEIASSFAHDLTPPDLTGHEPDPELAAQVKEFFDAEMAPRTKSKNR